MSKNNLSKMHEKCAPGQPYVDPSLNRVISIKERVMDPSKTDIRTTNEFAEPEEPLIREERVDESLRDIKFQLLMRKRKRQELLEYVSNRPLEKKQKTEPVADKVPENYEIYAQTAAVDFKLAKSEDEKLKVFDAYKDLLDVPEAKQLFDENVKILEEEAPKQIIEAEDKGINKLRDEAFKNINQEGKEEEVIEKQEEKKEAEPEKDLEDKLKGAEPIIVNEEEIVDKEIEKEKDIAPKKEEEKKEPEQRVEEPPKEEKVEAKEEEPNPNPPKKEEDIEIVAGANPQPSQIEESTEKREFVSEQRI